MKIMDRLNTRQLEELIEVKREELNRLYSEQGLNDFTLSVELTEAELTNLIQSFQENFHFNLTQEILVYGKVENSVLFQGVYVGKNAVIKDSVIMPNSYIGDNVVVNKAIIGSDVILHDDLEIGDGKEIAVIASKEEISSEDIVEEKNMA